jgi:rare lipoprotein A
MSRPRPLSRRHLAPGGLLAGLALTGTALSLGALQASPADAAAPSAATVAQAAAAPSAIAVPARVHRASRGSTRAALRPATRYVTKYIPVGRTFSGTASWYGGSFEGRHTANGETFSTRELTAASRTLPFGTRLRVCRHHRCVVVRVNDRGPYVGHRVLDLSRAARDRLGAFGVARVTATPVAKRKVAVHPPVRRRVAAPRPAPAPVLVPAAVQAPVERRQHQPDALLATGTLLAAGSALTWARRLRRPAGSSAAS